MVRASNVKELSMTTEDDFVRRLCIAHGAELQRFLVRRLGRKALAEEVAQETWLQLHRVTRPEDILSPQGLMYDVAAKLARRVERRTRIEAALDTGTDDMEFAPDEALRPEARVALEQAMGQLEMIVEQLPPKLNVVFVMRYVDQLSYQEISEHLGLSTNAVEKRLNRALKRCQKRLKALRINWLALD